MIKKIVVFLFFISISLSGLAESKNSIDGEGRFYAKDDDSLSFIKAQLLHSAFADVISKELKFLGLDAAQFWKSYDEKFESYFEPIKEQMQKKFGLDSKPTGEKTRQFNKAHRLKRLNLKSKYGRLDRAVTSYSIKKMTRSPQIPNSRYINLSASVDRKLLKRIYFQMISNSVNREIKTVYVSADFNINDLAWSDLGVELEAEFTGVIKEHWKKWLSENLKTRVGSVEVADTGKEKELDEFLKAPQAATSEIQTENAEGEDPQPINEYKDGLWLKMNIALSKVKEDFLMKERDFRLTGDFILIDLNTSEVVHSHDIPVTEVKYSFEKGAPLSTNLATWVYRTASTDFSKFDERIAAIPSQSNKSIELSISGAKNYLDFERVSEVLAIKGASQRFSAKLLNFEGDRGVLRLNYSGDKENLLKTLTSLGELKLDEKRTLAKAPDESPFSFQVITDPVASDVAGEKKPIEDKKNDKLLQQE